jgi:CBS domain-containing membrane protein
VTLLALLGLSTGDPLVYPPIGASAFLIFSMPGLPSAAPRNAIGGHVCGVAGGAVALACFGLLHRHGGAAGISGARAGAIGVSLLLATALMLVIKFSHPPAGATALMISLGIVTSPGEWLELLGAVALMCAMGVVVNRWAGFTYPLWSPSVPVLDGCPSCSESWPTAASACRHLKWMVSGFAAFPATGTRVNPVPRFSKAVRVYRKDLPALAAAGILMAQLNARAFVLQRQKTVTALIP